MQPFDIAPPALKAIMGDKLPSLVHLDDFDVKQEGERFTLTPKPVSGSAKVLPCAIAWRGVRSFRVDVLRAGVRAGASLLRFHEQLQLAGDGWSLLSIEALASTHSAPFVRREMLSLELRSPVTAFPTSGSAEYAIIGIEGDEHSTPFLTLLQGIEAERGRWAMSVPDGGVELMGAPGDLVPLVNHRRLGFTFEHRALPLPWLLYNAVGFAWRLSSPLVLALAGVWKESPGMRGPGLLEDPLEINGVGWRLLQTPRAVSPRAAGAPAPAAILSRELDFGEGLYALGRPLMDCVFDDFDPNNMSGFDSFVARHGRSSTPPPPFVW